MAKNMIEKLEAFLEADPKDIFTKFALALEYLKIDNKAKALQLFEELIASDPNYVGTYYHLGNLYRSLDRTEDAIRTYKAGTEIALKASDNQALSELQAALMELDNI